VISISSTSTPGAGYCARLCKPQGDVETLQAFYSELSQHPLPFATSEIHEISQIEGSVVSIERELLGTPLQRSSAEYDRDVAPAILGCLVQVLRSSCQDLWNFLPEGVGSGDGIASKEFDTEEFADGDDLATATAFTTEGYFSTPQVAGATSPLTEQAFLTG
jgi:hypothetical protein